MRYRNVLFTALAVPVLAWSAAALLQEEKKPAMEEFQEMPQPGPHNEALQELVGTWDVEMQMTMVPGQPPVKSKSVETVTPMGGFWVISDVKGQFMGMPFHGHGIYGYESNKKKHVGVWADAFGDWMMRGEGECENSCKKITMVYDGLDMVTGGRTTYREISEVKDADTRTFEMHGPKPDGSGQFVMMTGTCKRRK